MSAIPVRVVDLSEIVDDLKRGGYSEQQAKAQLEATKKVVQAYSEATRNDLATKSDIQNVRQEIQNVRVEMHKMKNSLIMWFFTTQVALGGLLIAAIAYFR